MHRFDTVDGVRRLGMSCDSPDSITVENTKGIRVIERLTCSDRPPHHCVIAYVVGTGTVLADGCSCAYSKGVTFSNGID